MPGGLGCGATPMRDVTLCFFHAPGNEEEQADARRLGGLRRKREKTLAGAFDFEGLSRSSRSGGSSRSPSSTPWPGELDRPGEDPDQRRPGRGEAPRDRRPPDPDRAARGRQVATRSDLGRRRPPGWRVTVARRVAALEASLGPTELVLHVLAEARTFASLEDYARSIIGQPVDAAPLSRIGAGTEASVRAAMKGAAARGGRRGRPTGRR